MRSLFLVQNIVTSFIFFEERWKNLRFCNFICYIYIEATKGCFFQRVYLYIWTIVRDELSTRSIRVHNLLTVHDNLWALKFDIFFWIAKRHWWYPPPTHTDTHRHTHHSVITGGAFNVCLLTKFCRLATVCGVIIYTKFQNNWILGNFGFFNGVYFCRYSMVNGMVKNEFFWLN